jgi:hypothetical protein
MVQKEQRGQAEQMRFVVRLLMSTNKAAEILRGAHPLVAFAKQGRRKPEDLFDPSPPPRKAGVHVAPPVDLMHNQQLLQFQEQQWHRLIMLHLFQCDYR